MSSETFQTLDMDADRALFEGAVDGLICVFHRNERPLHGLSGLLDWRFRGMISQCLRQGAIQGEAGECVYLPTMRHGRVLHLVLAGAGNSEQPGARGKLPAETIEKLREDLKSLKIARIGVSRQDFGGVPDSFFTQQLKGVGLWVAP